jgi:hypothetical protein
MTRDDYIELLRQNGVIPAEPAPSFRFKQHSRH